MSLRDTLLSVNPVFTCRRGRLLLLDSSPQFPRVHFVARCLSRFAQGLVDLVEADAGDLRQRVVWSDCLLEAGERGREK